MMRSLDEFLRSEWMDSSEHWQDHGRTHELAALEYTARHGLMSENAWQRLHQLRRESKERAQGMKDDQHTVTHSHDNLRQHTHNIPFATQEHNETRRTAAVVRTGPEAGSRVRLSIEGEVQAPSVGNYNQRPGEIILKDASGSLHFLDARSLSLKVTTLEHAPPPHWPPSPGEVWEDKNGKHWVCRPDKIQRWMLSGLVEARLPLRSSESERIAMHGPWKRVLAACAGSG